MSERKKIGQVTYCGENYGSVLQCYATQSILLKYNIDCVLLQRREVGIGSILQRMSYRIDRTMTYLHYPKYKDEFDGMLYQLKNGNSSSMNEEAREKIKEFIDSRINVCTCSYRKLKKIARTNRFIAFISGSDQIWSATWFVTNKMWFLRFAPRYKRVAWMPSFGSGHIAEYNARKYAKYINEYQYLSVRELSGQRIIQDLTGQLPEVLSDPVVLLSSKEWECFASERLWNEKYILMFFLDTPSKIALDMMRKLQASTGYKIVTFSYEYDCLREASIKGGDPKDFISAIQYAEFVLTDSFHACMFSLILNTPFFVFYRNASLGSKQSARITDLLNTFREEKRLITVSRKIEDRDFLLDQNRNESILNEKRDSILHYLEKILTDIVVD